MKVIAGNWKMNLGLKESKDLFENISRYVENNPAPATVIVFPQVVVSSLIAQEAKQKGSILKVGVQNISEFEKGAYTGEIAGKIAVEVGFQYALVGHSERRHVLLEKNSTMKKRIQNALNENLEVIYCIGETLAERNSGIMEKVLAEQLEPCLEFISSKKVFIAYEPVWAIGTGVNASPQEAESAHAFIKNFVAQKLGQQNISKLFVLYGGSVNVSNALELLNTNGIDGLLIGGASLKLDDFCRIISMTK